MKTLRYVAILIAVAVAAFVFLMPDDERQVSLQGVQGTPWQIESLPNGNSRVFGLELSQSTLEDARSQFGDLMKIGIVASEGETGSLEAYYDSVTAGVILGKLILVGALEPATLTAMRARSIDRTHMNASTFRYLLAPEDLALAMRAPVTAITFVPAADLDEETVVKRFGEPLERVRVSEQLVHFLYPHLGLDLLLDRDGKEVLQYVAPREFERLRRPLMEAGARLPAAAD